MIINSGSSPEERSSIGIPLPEFPPRLLRSLTKDLKGRDDLLTLHRRQVDPWESGILLLMGRTLSLRESQARQQRDRASDGQSCSDLLATSPESLNHWRFHFLWRTIGSQWFNGTPRSTRPGGFSRSVQLVYQGPYGSLCEFFAELAVAGIDYQPVEDEILRGCFSRAITSWIHPSTSKLEFWRWDVVLWR